MLQTDKEIDEEMERDAVVPETMAEIVLAQLQAMLTLEEQEVLKVASVAGVHFNLQLILTSKCFLLLIAVPYLPPMDIQHFFFELN